MAHVREAALGHVSEIADAESPFTPRGCPFQVWSLGELIRLQRVVSRRHAHTFNPRADRVRYDPRHERAPRVDSRQYSANASSG